MTRYDDEAYVPSPTGARRGPAGSDHPAQPRPMSEEDLLLTALDISHCRYRERHQHSAAVIVLLYALGLVGWLAGAVWLLRWVGR